MWGGIALSAHSLGGGALEALDLRLGQHLGKRSRALHLQVVLGEAAHSSQASQPRRKKRAGWDMGRYHILRQRT